MAPLVLEGATLGEKHKYYNKLVQELASNNQTSKPNKLDSEAADIDNLVKIDLACNNRNVEYILDVLKSEDMLYVSRAIKRSTWLITEQQYANIINPEYLQTQLYPQMTAKSINKLMQHIKLNLKDEQRVEAFYNYVKDKDPAKALKWLPYCSIVFIEKVIKEKADIPLTLLKRLCEKSFTILEIYIQKNPYYKRSALEKTMFLLNNYTEKYLDIVDTLQTYENIQIQEKYTKIIMTKCPERIWSNFEKYIRRLDTKTLARYVKKDELKDFLVKNAKNKEILPYLTFERLQHYLKYMPAKERFDFIKKNFIDKVTKTDDSLSDEQNDDVIMYCSSTACNTSQNVYKWYRFAPFDVALPDLKKLIRAESSPTERSAMLGILLSNAGRNFQHIQMVLQYFHDKHINEPFKFKIQFINSLLSQTDTHTFDEKTWNILNEIFHSMEVYIESTNNVQSCLKAIIFYKVLHNEKIPDIIKKKFEFNTCKTIIKKLKQEHKDKIFGYLYNLTLTKIKNRSIAQESDLNKVISLTTDILNLLIDWEKNLIDYPVIIDQIKEIINIKKDNSWSTNLSSLYNINKSWRKHLFEESIVMAPSENVCINALKHEPELLSRYENAVEAICSDDAISLRRLLSKLRIYWPQSLAKQWAETYLSRLDEPSSHKAVISGLCIILTQKLLLDVIKKYAPAESKINWSQEDELTLSLRKQISKMMYIARPLLPVDTVLLYAKGDYLQYAIPSLNAILNNISCVKSQLEILKLLNAPVSLQKFGIRYAFIKLQPAELKQIFSDIWKTSKNPSIRTALFTHTYDLLCKEKNPSMAIEISELLNSFIDNLSQDENKLIYNKLGKVHEIPINVRANIYKKSYLFLKSLPAKANCEYTLKRVQEHAPSIINILEPDFITDVLLQSVAEIFPSKDCVVVDILVAYLLHSQDEETQTKKYEHILIPVLNSSLPSWYYKHDGEYYSNMDKLLKQLTDKLKEYIVDKKAVVPVKLFTNIQRRLEESLPIQENYINLTTWKLTVAYVKLIDEHKSLLSEPQPESQMKQDETSENADEKWDNLNLKIMPLLGKICQQFLKEDVDKYFPSIYLIFKRAFNNFFDNFRVSYIMKYHTFKEILCEDFIQSYLLVCALWPLYSYEEDEKTILSEIRKLLFKHPSVESKMHYYKKFSDIPDPDIENF